MTTRFIERHTAPARNPAAIFLLGASAVWAGIAAVAMLAPAIAGMSLGSPGTFATMALGCLIAGALTDCFVVVRQKTEVVVEVFGRYSATLEPGLRVKLPWPIAQVAATVRMDTQQLVAPARIKTKDNVFVTLPIHLQLHVSDAKLALYELQDPENQIASFVLNVVRARTAGMNMQEIFDQRDTIGDAVEHGWSPAAAQAEGQPAPEQDAAGRESVAAKLRDKFGFKIDSVLVEQPAIPKEIEDASSRVVAAQRLQEAATMEGEATRIKLVAAATAEKESKKLQGEGAAAQLEAVAQGRAKALETVKKAAGGDADPERALAFMMTTQYIDAMREIGHGKGHVIMLPGSVGDVQKIVGGLVAAGDAANAVRAAGEAPAASPAPPPAGGASTATASGPGGQA